MSTIKFKPDLESLQGRLKIRVQLKNGKWREHEVFRAQNQILTMSESAKKICPRLK